MHKVPFCWQEVVFATIFIVCLLGTAIGSAAIAGLWGSVPEACPHPDSGDDACDTIPLAATNALQCVSEY